MPRPNEVAGTLEASVSPEKIPGIVDKLRSSFNSDRTRSKEWRISQLKALDRMLTEGRDLLCEALYQDLHKSKIECFFQEFAMSHTEIYEMIKDIDELMGDEVVGTDMANAPGTSVIQKDPLGVCLVLGAWNYNVLLSIQPMIGAIAAGNCVIMKPGSYAENSGRVMCDLIAKYMDPECVVAVNGSPFVGKVVAQAAAKHLTPVVLELGGKSPCIIDKTTDLYVAARRTAFGALMNSGQTCVRPDYLMVHDEVADKFIETLKSVIEGFYENDPKGTEFYGRLINDSAFTRLMKCVEDGREYIVHGGDSDASEKYIEPTVFDFGRDMEAFSKSELMGDEIFGPLIPIFRFRNLDSEVIQFIRSRPKPLALYVFSTDTNFSERVLRLTSSGGAIVNDAVVHLGNSCLPFGGVGASGMGSYHGHQSFNSFSHRKSVLKKSTFLDPDMRYPPYTNFKQNVLKMGFEPYIGYYYHALAAKLGDKKNWIIFLLAILLVRAHLSK